MDGGGGGTVTAHAFTPSAKEEKMEHHPICGDIAIIYTSPTRTLKKVLSCWRVPLLNGHHLHTHPHEPPVQLIYRRRMRSGERPYLNGLPS